MTRYSNLARRIARLQAAARPPQADYMQSPEWHTIQTIMTSVLPLYPEAQSAVESALFFIRAEKSASQEAVRCALVRALAPFLDARIALAEALYNHDRKT